MTYGAPPGSTEPTYMMALEWCDGDLEGVVLDRKKHPEFTMKTALQLATGVACGMAYIHRKDVLHLDIKMARKIRVSSGSVAIDQPTRRSPFPCA